ncbi:thioredoxin family protein [Flammeovirga kamogawensis]|uniref:DUF255 domain-containing protein n=1 Tax=Flammeovirga kamogawensis TaxID=373891 RepID=A0ABX8GYN9_9BACT|nr:DUF255 domain-containing protein [Flammeovirga kamogawensis]MBB6460690.1 thioredoxin-related protein [Flammeovirga kamogawensis]QWG08045.1 DUF255 domain-containing protein [Flammeovirga kamogawensis]TRX69852.1 DUF255 domain-containing protein [Flammeovirga kamogawensis]
MKKITFFLILFIFQITDLYAQEKINWLSFTEAINLNKIQPKKIVVDVYTDWCTWCKKMDRKTFSDPKIIEYMNTNFYAVKLDAEGKLPISFQGETFVYHKEKGTGYHELASTLLNGNMSYPTVVVLFVGKDEELLTQPIPLQGYQNKEKMLMVLSYLEEADLEKQSFSDFQKTYTSPYK